MQAIAKMLLLVALGAGTLPSAADEVRLSDAALDRIRAADARAILLAFGTATTAGPGDTVVHINGAAISDGGSAAAHATVHSHAALAGGEPGSVTASSSVLASTSLGVAATDD